MHGRWWLGCNLQGWLQGKVAKVHLNTMFVVAYHVLSNVLYPRTSAVLILGRPPLNCVWRMSMIPDSHVR